MNETEVPELVGKIITCAKIDEYDQRGTRAST